MSALLVHSTFPSHDSIFLISKIWLTAFIFSSERANIPRIGFLAMRYVTNIIFHTSAISTKAKKVIPLAFRASVLFTIRQNEIASAADKIPLLSGREKECAHIKSIVTFS